MYNYRFFLLVVFVGIGFFYHICAMELVDITFEPKGTPIDVWHLCSSEYRRNISEVPNMAGLEARRLSFEKEHYLSQDISTLDHLLYFSTIQKDSNPVKTLFTQKQQHQFDTAESIKRWVPRCFIINAAFIGFTASFPFVSAVSFLQCSNGTLADCLSSTATVLTPVTVSVVGALLVGFSSLYATGISPDLSSRNADKVQDSIDDLRRQYATIAKYWMDIYFNSPEKAEYIANAFDIEELKKRAQIKTGKKKLGGKLVNPLEEAWHFVKHQRILVTFTEIENYIYNKINSRRIEFLEKMVKK